MIRNENAVSPVVGVMLMLVVTIIIAAVVSAFAGGLAGTTETPPQASIAVKTGYGWNFYGDAIDRNVFDITFEHLSGDPINTRDIEIITWLTMPNGTVVKHSQNANSPYMRVSTSAGGKYARLPYLYDTQIYDEFYLEDEDIDAGETLNCWFGSYVLMPGQMARTYKKDATAAFLGLVDEGDCYTADGAAYTAGAELLEECIQAQCPLEVKILHVPSGKYILDTEITLQG
jgi:FlaG/FlaF family flagellin (archaellin)